MAVHEEFDNVHLLCRKGRRKRVAEQTVSQPATQSYNGCCRMQSKQDASFVYCLEPLICALVATMRLF